MTADNQELLQRMKGLLAVARAAVKALGGDLSELNYDPDSIRFLTSDGADAISEMENSLTPSAPPEVMRDAVLECIPSNWCDEILTGNKSIP
ncbi:MAG: hypothetical protein ACREH5_09050, partial [Candidatus Omnitrophota bacterium]